MGIIRDNPVLRRELRRLSLSALRDLRGWKRLAVLAVVTAALFWGGVQVCAQALRSAYPSFSADFFAWAWAGLTVMLVPGWTLRAISKEKTQSTWDALIVSRLLPGEIFFGKLLAPLVVAWSFGLMLLPLCLLLVSADRPAYWQASLASVFFAYAFAVLNGLFFGAMGLVASARFREPSLAAVVIYSLMLAAMVLPFAAREAFMGPGRWSDNPVDVLIEATPGRMDTLPTDGLLLVSVSILLLPVLLRVGPALVCRPARTAWRERSGKAWA